MSKNTEKQRQHKKTANMFYWNSNSRVVFICFTAGADPGFFKGEGEGEHAQNVLQFENWNLILKR